MAYRMSTQSPFQPPTFAREVRGRCCAGCKNPFVGCARGECMCHRKQEEAARVIGTAPHPDATPETFYQKLVAAHRFAGWPLKVTAA